MLTKTLYGDVTDGNAVELDDLAVFFDLWLLWDCAETAWYDLDGNCKVTFYEFALLAQNWRQVL